MGEEVICHHYFTSTSTPVTPYSLVPRFEKSGKRFASLFFVVRLTRQVPAEFGESPVGLVLIIRSLI